MGMNNRKLQRRFAFPTFTGARRIPGMSDRRRSDWDFLRYYAPPQLTFRGQLILLALVCAAVVLFLTGDLIIRFVGGN